MKLTEILDLDEESGDDEVLANFRNKNNNGLQGRNNKRYQQARNNSSLDNYANQKVPAQKPFKKQKQHFQYSNESVQNLVENLNTGDYKKGSNIIMSTPQLVKGNKL